jgi:microsomal dipeptidase-like Zn-dependent dipeptidase
MPVEKKIKANTKRFSREHLNMAIQSILYEVDSFDELIRHIKELTSRAGIKVIGMKTLYTPRGELEEVDKTNDWIKDVLSYDGVMERFNYK